MVNVTKTGFIFLGFWRWLSGDTTHIQHIRSKQSACHLLDRQSDTKTGRQNQYDYRHITCMALDGQDRWSHLSPTDRSDGVQ